MVISAPFHPPTGNRPPLSLGMLGAAAVIPVLQIFLNISIVTPRSLSPASYIGQSDAFSIQFSLTRSYYVNYQVTWIISGG